MSWDATHSLHLGSFLDAYSFVVSYLSWSFLQFGSSWPFLVFGCHFLCAFCIWLYLFVFILLCFLRAFVWMMLVIMSCLLHLRGLKACLHFLALVVLIAA